MTLNLTAREYRDLRNALNGAIARLERTTRRSKVLGRLRRLRARKFGRRVRTVRAKALRIGGEQGRLFKEAA